MLLLGTTVEQAWARLRAHLADERGGVSTIAGIAALTVAVLAAAGVVASVMMDHANAIPAPGASSAPVE